MIRLKNIYELIRLAWKTSEKRYLILPSTTNDNSVSVIEASSYEEAKRKSLELMRNGGVTKIRIVLEVTKMEQRAELNR